MRHGWICLNKPRGVTSTQALAQVRRVLDRVKAGHCGTLDPIASGVLPIALGEATKAIRLLLSSEKEYRFRVRWGIATNTADASGSVIDRQDRRPKRDEIINVLPKFLGLSEQTPPAFSALKIKGRRAYAKARQGETVVLAKRPIEIHSLTLERVIDSDHAEFRTVCGKGVYIRSLATDLARSLNTTAHIAALERVRVGWFTLDKTIPLNATRTEMTIYPLEVPLTDHPALSFDQDQVQQLRHGRLLPSNTAPVCPLALAFHERSLVALIQITSEAIIPLRIFNS